ncbi:hypothetical protein MLD38_006163 [Melastoma candidum]|uniref:Uncharacterized protein n=1 Tax=Melastoma candidum TaxID=119954 RepID=A0ACB9RQ23_9MYRT|nr:hypothetical protein MLD38_006163 [Melastoma candidum]
MSPVHMDLSNSGRRSFVLRQNTKHVDRELLKSGPLPLPLPLPASSNPGSPWALSPLRTLPLPPLFYTCIASLHRNEGGVHSMALSKELVFTGSQSSRIRAWRKPDCLERGCIKAGLGETRAMLCYSNILFSSHKDHRIRVWNISASDVDIQYKKVATLPKRSGIFPFKRTSPHQHTERISCMAYHHVKGLLYTGSHDRTVRVWRVADSACVDTFLAHDNRVNEIVVNQEDGCVFTCSSDGSIKIWRRVYKEGSHTLTMRLRFQEFPINALALSSSVDNYFLYSGSSDGSVNFWQKEPTSFRFSHGGFLQGHRLAVLCLAVMGRLVFSGSEDTTIRVWKREEGSSIHECLAVMDGHQGPVRCVAACLEMDKVVKGYLVYSASVDQTFKVWRVKVLPDEQVLFLGNSDNVSLSDDVNVNDGNDVVIREGLVYHQYYDMSPVLSPSWVEKKRQGGGYFQ